MKRNLLRKIIIFWVILLQISLVLNPGIGLKETESITAVEDATIDAFETTLNYGNESHLEVGLGYDWLEALIKFDLSNSPEDFYKAELKLEFTSFSHFDTITSLLEIYETTTNWSEYTITWENAPSHGVLITSGYVAEVGMYSFQITEAVLGILINWSICFTSDTEDWIRIASKQCSSSYYPPRIIFYYNTSDLPTLLVGIIVSLVGLSIIVVVLYKRYSKKRE